MESCRYVGVMRGDNHDFSTNYYALEEADYDRPVVAVSNQLNIAGAAIRLTAT